MDRFRIDTPSVNAALSQASVQPEDPGTQEPVGQAEVSQEPVVTSVKVDLSDSEE